MDIQNTLNPMFQYASNYKFFSFKQSFSELKSTQQNDKFLDAFLMQAQIKLFSGDETLLSDLEKAEKFDGMPKFPCLNSSWLPDSNNRFVVFKKTPGSLRHFLETLSLTKEQFYRWYGEAGVGMVNQVRSEILYFWGCFDEAIGLAQQQYNNNESKSTDKMLSLYVLFRCYLATGAIKNAQQSMLDIVRISRNFPECIGSYQNIRNWANLTTGWSGDTPRFNCTTPGVMTPILDDRLTAIRNGISRLSVLEEPFVEYAQDNYEEAYTVRQYYMDIFHAIYWFQSGYFQQAESNFMRAYSISLASGLAMPFVEYGKQMIPLLEHVKKSDASCSHDWIDMILSFAEQYEDSLNAYRA